VKVLFISAEVAPFSKTGGLADVASALPGRLSQLGQDVMVVSPLYSSIDRQAHGLRREAAEIPFSWGTRPASFGALVAPDRRNWFVDLPHLYSRGSIYTADPDEHVRFLILTLAALELCRHRQWRPDIVHANDWHTAMAPLYLRSIYRADPVLGGARTVFTIHNLAYQGVFDAGLAGDIGLGDQQSLLHQEHLQDGFVNFMEHALLYSDSITTVSPTYAREIQTPEMGAGLDAILRRRASDLVGILNGIDTSVWNPATDQYLEANFSASDLEGKAKNKAALLDEAGIDRSDLPLLGLVSRLTAQKGIELLVRPLMAMLEADQVRFVAVGTGEPRYQEALAWLAASHPGKARFAAVYDERLAHLIEAGADLFAMPSRYEPSGLNQMYSLAYGTAPVVRKTGGLADTVRQYRADTREGNGFVFEQFAEEALSSALGEALHLYRDRESWRRMQLNGMTEDNSWERRSAEYLDLYQTLIRS
jgi:starch synthase